MRQCLNAMFALFSLDELHVGACTTFRILACKEVDAECIAMEACQGDELP